jgi:hypothetical protein
VIGCDRVAENRKGAGAAYSELGFVNEG